MTGATRHGAHSVAHASRSGAESLIQGYRYLRDEQPLVLGALAIAAGMLIGAMVPATRKEDEWLGEHSDEAAERLREQARQAADQAKTTAVNAAEAARQAAMADLGGGEREQGGSESRDESSIASPGQSPAGSTGAQGGAGGAI